MTPEAKARVQSMLLAELKSDEPRKWYYISIADKSTFYGGCFILAHGPTDAWRLMHHLGLFPEGSGAETQTYGPVDDNLMDKFTPPDKRWRLLNKDEVKAL